MNTEWQEFLVSAGAVLSDGGALHFPSDKELAADSTVSAISGDVVLRITGDEAESFLQGQFSNDIAALGIPGSQLNTWSNPKGRVLTLFRIIRDTEGYLIRMPAELVEPVQKRLKMFVLMAKVSIEQQPDLVSFGVAGNQAAKVLENSVQTLPGQVDDTVQANNITVCRVRGDVDRFEVIAPLDSALALWTDLTEVCQPTGESVWRLQNIDAGVPSIGAATTEAFVLQMLNLQHIDGVSFKKGCFPGQEVVARMQYLGKLKRRMYRAEGLLENGPVPEAGAEVSNKDVASAVGKVVDAQLVGDGTFRLLMVNAIAATEAPLFLDKEATQPLTLLDLPYSVEAEDK